MAAELNLEIITPSKKSFSGNVFSVTVPGTLGSFQVLKNHAPILSIFDIGVVKVEENENSPVYYSTAGGTIEVLKNKVLILADSIEKASDIDLNRAQSALERAKNRLTNKDVEKINVTRAEAALARATNRIKVYEKYSKN